MTVAASRGSLKMPLLGERREVRAEHLDRSETVVQQNRLLCCELRFLEGAIAHAAARAAPLPAR